jgi:F-type H+-transporting ATPase subunit epsilon
MIPDKIDLEIVTPERLVLSETVDSVILPGSEGYFGVLPSHAPFFTSLAAGEIEMFAAGKKRFLAVSGGFAEVLRDRVSVLAETCELAEEIDVERADRSRKKAEETLGAADVSAAEFARAEARLKRAIARIQSGKRIGR